MINANIKIKFFITLCVTLIIALSPSCKKESAADRHQVIHEKTDVGASDNTNAAPRAQEKRLSADTLDPAERWAATLFVGFEYDCRTHAAADSLCAGYGRQSKGSIRGVVYNTIISEDNTAVRNGPSYESEILFYVSRFTRIQILGVSRESTLIDNDHWIKVRVKTDDGIWMDGEYWVFSRYVAYRGGEKILPIDLTVESENDILVGRYEIDGETKTVSLFMISDNVHDFQMFYYCMHREGSHYRLVPGLYVLHANGELAHVSYLSPLRQEQ